MTAEGAWQVPPGSQDQGLGWKEGWPRACLVAGGSQPYRRPGPDKETGKPLIVLGLSVSEVPRTSCAEPVVWKSGCSSGFLGFPCYSPFNTLSCRQPARLATKRRIVSHKFVRSCLPRREKGNVQKKRCCVFILFIALGTVACKHSQLQIFLRE